MDAVNATLTKSRAKVKVAYIDDLYPHGYNHSDLASHKGIIHVPYLVGQLLVQGQGWGDWGPPAEREGERSIYPSLFSSFYSNPPYIEYLPFI